MKAEEFWEEFRNLEAHATRNPAAAIALAVDLGHRWASSTSGYIRPLPPGRRLPEVK